MRVRKLAGTLGVFCGLIFAAIWLAGCKTGSKDPTFSDAQPHGQPTGGASIPAHQPDSEGAQATGPSSNDSADVIHVQDALIVSFSDLPYVQPPIDDRVKDDGTIKLIEDQTFHVAGKTRGEVEADIHDRYVRDKRLFKIMTVSVQKQNNSQFYYVGGSEEHTSELQ